MDTNITNIKDLVETVERTENSMKLSLDNRDFEEYNHVKRLFLKAKEDLCNAVRKAYSSLSNNDSKLIPNPTKSPSENCIVCDNPIRRCIMKGNKSVIEVMSFDGKCKTCYESGLQNEQQKIGSEYEKEEKDVEI